MRYATLMAEAKAEYDAWATREIPHRVHRPRAPKAACRHGHPLSGENLYLDSRHRRGCRTCRRAQWTRAYARRTKAA